MYIKFKTIIYQNLKQLTVHLEQLTAMFSGSGDLNPVLKTIRLKARNARPLLYHVRSIHHNIPTRAGF
jgi:hypothetical protein